MGKASAQGAGECRFESHWSAVASSQVGHFYIRNSVTRTQWPRGPMDKASAYGAGDCRFESYRGHALSLIAVASFPLLHKFKSQL